MTKKTYKVLAKDLAKYFHAADFSGYENWEVAEEIHDSVLHILCKHLKADNPNFNKTLFMEAVEKED